MVPNVGGDGVDEAAAAFIVDGEVFEQGSDDVDFDGSLWF